MQTTNGYLLALIIIGCEIALLCTLHFDNLERQTLYKAGMNAYLKENFHEAVHFYK
jgi:hypothetical protein